jgi:glycine cleavage system aminomethyltransferase T/glycine/D-amino acid oxidase-like deaminating enzyme
VSMQPESTVSGPTGVLPDRASVVVVGGGVIGTSIAYHLAKAGVKDVVLLERKQLTSGTTWHAAGLITSAGMTSETTLWMSRYTRDLLPALEKETGQDTGFNPIGHLHLACTERRLETMTREAAFARAHGVDAQMVGAGDVKDFWPEAKVDDILAALYVADEGRANPADVTMALARGARMHGATIIEGMPVTGFTQANGRVTGVVTDQGTIECETVVNACGMWARQLGELAGVTVPLQAAEHYYMITEPVEWAHPNLPVVEDPDLYGYYREEGGGILVGLFEPIAGPWHVDAIPEDLGFAVLPPDWDRTGGFLSDAMDRFPALHEAGIKIFFCGPESFTNDLGPMLGEAPELRGYFTAAGLNSLGILLSGGVGSLLAQWIVDGTAPMDVTGLSVDRAFPYQNSPAFRKDRTVEQLGAFFGDAAFPTWHQKTARNVRRSVVHDRLAAANGRFGLSSGWEFPEWFALGDEADTLTPGWGRDESFPAQEAEHRAVREAVGVMDMSLMAKVLVTGRDAEALLNRVALSNMSVPVGRIVYTQFCDDRGRIQADVTVTRRGEDAFMVIGSDIIHRRIIAWLQRHTPEDAHVSIVDMTSATTLLTVQGPKSRELLQRVSSADFSNQAFPYMTSREIDLHYARCLAVRVTYLGELGWELHVPTEMALTVYDALFANGEDLGLRNAGILAMNSLRLEKAYRDYGLDIDNSDTPLDAGLDFIVAWDKPGGFVGREALVAQRDAGTRTSRMVQVLLQDPEPLLYHHEQVYRDGVHIGENRNGAYGHTLGGAVGLAMLESEDGITDDMISTGSYEVDVNGAMVPATVSLTPLYDPKRERILDR